MVFLLKLTICWGFFALLYALLLRSETFFRANRLYLIGTLLAGIALAAVSDQLLPPMQEDRLPMFTLPVVSAGFEQAEVVSQQLEGVDYLWLLYLTGAGLMLLRTLWGVGRLLQMAANATSEWLPGGCLLMRSEQVQTPFSFFKWIFVPADWDHSPGVGAEYMLAHERAHAEGLHSLDVMLVECLCAVFWFHPLVYWYRRSLRTVHEYLADAEASYQTDKKQYGLLLIRQSQSGMPVAFANHFFQSPLKQRLIMLMKQHSAPVRAIRYGLVLPLAGLFILLFQQAPVLAQEVNRKGDAYDHQMQVPTSTPAEQVAQDNPCEQEPAFPGGMGALMDFLSKNIQYPKNAEGNLQEGVVVTSFTVNEVGGIQNVYVKNPTEMPAVYNAEALRVVSMLPKWTPGKKNCKTGLFELCIPIKFKANGQPVSKAQQPVSNVSDLQTPPRFTGGQEALFKFLIENIKYPEAAKQAKAEGTVLVKFVVEKDGSISQVEAPDSNGIHADLVTEAIRVSQSMPKWVPGVLNGEIVRVQFALPIRFKLD